MTVSVKKQFDNVSDGIQNMIAAATHDYTKCNFNESMNKTFTEGWVVKEGQKYIQKYTYSTLLCIRILHIRTVFGQYCTYIHILYSTAYILYIHIVIK